MSKAPIKVDHSYLMDKVMLRVNHLPRKKAITVLDAFHGSGTIWKNVRKKTEKEIQVVGIDKKPGKGPGLTLEGDNLKFIPSLDLSPYDVIDLDAYGVPYRVLKEIFKNGSARKGAYVFATFIQSVQGRLPTEMLEELGYTKAMIKKAPALLCRHGLEKLTNFLSILGVKSINYISKDRKYYLYFKMPC